ncbi:LamG domain-containing protein, partial [bacterium]|nr:LamG domain-containing protein [bacterium]
MLGKRLINSNDAAAGGSCTTNTNDYPTTNVAYYKMSSAADEKGTYNGTATNVNFNVAGKFGNAGEFNGSSSQIAVAKISQLTDDVSVSLWVNLASTSSGSYLRMFSLNAVQNGWAGTLAVRYQPNSGNFNIAVGNGNSAETAVLNHTYALTQSTWYHICITRNDSTNVTKLYINGSEEDSETVSATATIQSNASSSIGTSVPIYGPTVWNGKIDQVRIFDSALNASQVTQLYNEVYCVPTIVPTDNFNTVLYTGIGTSKSVTGVGFQPDLVWGKARDSGALSHILFDVVRGENKQISADLQDAQVVRGSAAYEFDDDGFTVTTAGNLNNPNDFVAWCWKAGGAAVSNTDGTITSQVSANVDAGFSIVKYTGNGNNSTIGHGLSVAPDLIITKGIDSVVGNTNWLVYNSISGATGRMFLNLSLGFTIGSTAYNDTEPTSSVFTIGTTGDINGNGAAYIAYCFHSVAGYSKIGSYTGTGVSNNNTIITGFRPAFVMIKRTDVAANWRILDNKRSTTNPINKELYPPLSNAEGTFSALDFLSNGFQIINTDGSYNSSIGTYIFMAFAEEALPYVTRNATDPFGDSSEVALYKFEDDATDAEGNYDANSSPNVTYASGYINKAAVFNGSSSLISLPTGVDRNNNFTLSFWVNFDTLSDYDSLITLQINYRVYVNAMANGSLDFKGGNTTLSTNAGVVATGNWYNIVCTKSSTLVGGKATIIYVNGVEVASNNNTSNADGASDTGLNLLGAYNANAAGGNFFYLDGKL